MTLPILDFNFLSPFSPLPKEVGTSNEDTASTTCSTQGDLDDLDTSSSDTESTASTTPRSRCDTPRGAIASFKASTPSIALVPPSYKFDSHFNLDHAVSEFMFLQQEVVRRFLTVSEENIITDQKKQEGVGERLRESRYKHSDKEEELQPWANAKDGLCYLSSAATIIAGISAGMTFGGAALIALGALTLFNQFSGGALSKGIAEHTGCSESTADLGLTLLSAAGGIGAAASGVGAARAAADLTVFERGIETFKSATYLFEGAANIGLEYKKSEVTHVEVETEKLQILLEKLKEENTADSKLIQDYFNSLERLTSHLSNIQEGNNGLSQVLVR
jgi:hypothetical protein